MAIAPLSCAGLFGAAFFVNADAKPCIALLHALSRGPALHYTGFPFVRAKRRQLSNLAALIGERRNQQAFSICSTPHINRCVFTLSNAVQNNANSRQGRGNHGVHVRPGGGLLPFGIHDHGQVRRRDLAGHDQRGDCSGRKVVQRRGRNRRRREEEERKRISRDLHDEVEKLRKRKANGDDVEEIVKKVSDMESEMRGKFNSLQSGNTELLDGMRKLMFSVDQLRQEVATQKQQVTTLQETNKASVWARIPVWSWIFMAIGLFAVLQLGLERYAELKGVLP